MTSLVETHERFDSTSAAGAMFMAQLPERIPVGFILSDLGTSTVSTFPVEIVSRSPWPAYQTTSGLFPLLGKRSGGAIAEFHRLSGFTWEQLARLFNVNRRSLHFWASGKAMAPRNEEHLQRLLAVVRKIDRGSASANRAALLVARDDGTIPFDLLAEGHYERVVSLLHNGEAVARLVPPRLSAQAKAARAPRRPEELVDALQDPVHRETGIARAARSVKVRSGR